jgi:hypothetical protein
MSQDAEYQPWHKYFWYKMMAWLYYRAVRMFASGYFYYGDSERTLEDLEAELRPEEI